jgi:sulfopyruvate decarboxylase TPP-binding subunit
MLVTMRGEWGEGNPWQVPMGRAVMPVLAALGVHCIHVEHAADVVPATNALLTMSFAAGCACALLLGQRLIGAKAFQ